MHYKTEMTPGSAGRLKRHHRCIALQILVYPEAAFAPGTYHVSSQSLERSGYGRMSFHRFSKHWRDLALNAVPRSDDGDTRIIHEPALSAVRGRSNCGRLRLF